MSLEIGRAARATCVLALAICSAAACGGDAEPAAAVANPVAGAASGGRGAIAGGNAQAAAGVRAPAVAGAAATPAPGPATSQGGAGSGSIGNADSAQALTQLTAYLAQARAMRGALAAQPFAKVALTKADAEAARAMLWDDFAAMVRQTRAAEMGATQSVPKSFELDGRTLRYYMAVRGDKPAGGRSLFISMHGGGDAAADVNDSQWDNQIELVEGYKPKDAIWIAPRAPSDAWNMWFTDEIDALFQHLITSMIVFEGVNPNKVYINGYSAGGDGVYQIGPRMADYWAAAGMSAGHPNTASPLNLRNLGFAIHVGGEDTAFDRNKKGEEWGKMLEELAKADPGGYANQWQVHAGLGHWMNLEDAVSIEFMQRFTRDPVPKKVVWRQAELTRTRMYWLAVDAGESVTGSTVRASYAGNAVTIAESINVSRLRIRFSDAMMDLDSPVRVEGSARELFSGMVPRTIEVLARTLEERGDPALMFSGEVEVQLR